MFKVGSIAAMVFFLALPAVAQEGEPEEVDLTPEENVGWSPRNVGAGISTLVTGPSFWYAQKRTRVDTVPADAMLALYYIRSNFQKRFERAVAPVVIVGPSRIEATSRDVIAVRAAAQGYLTKEFKYRLFEAPEHVLLELEPLPNSLVFLGFTHLAGRSTITLRTTEEPEIRVSKGRGADGFTLALTQTATKLESQPGTASGHLKGIAVEQLGEDLVVRVTTRAPDLEVRSKSSYDPIRKEHLYSIDVVRKGSRSPNNMQVRGEIERVGFTRGNPCEEAFSSELRRQLDQQMLARAFRPTGGVAWFYQREAMLRLGRLDSGKVETLGGEKFRTGSPIELALALQSASTVRDYLALLGAIARSQPDPPEFLRALLAPEMTPEEFAPIYSAATRERATCS
jgi:hypothetical protein